MKKTYILILVLVVGYCFIMLFAFGIPEISRKNKLRNESNIVIGYDTFFNYNSETKWQNSNQKIVHGTTMYDVYMDKSYKGKYDLELVRDKWYYFDSNDVSTDLTGELFAYSGKRKIELINYNVSSINSGDLKYLNNILSSDINVSEVMLSDLTVNQKITIDVDSDGKYEYLYAISNFYCETCLNTDNLFSVVFLVDGEDVFLLNKSYNGDEYSLPLYEIAYIIDIDDNKDYQIILSRSTNGNNKIYHDMYFRTKKGYKLVVSSGG